MGTCYSSTKDDISEAEAVTCSQVSQPRKHVYVDLRAASEDAKLFKDEEFPPNSASYGSDDEEVQWMRASNLAKIHGQKPKFFDANGASRFDVKQGSLGDCWFLAALSDLPMYPKLFKKVVPPSDQGTPQNFDGGNCAFQFRFWHYGEWETVVVDDFLPTFNGQLKCVRSGNPYEFWSALVEKAYAKHYGNYALALKGGKAAEALEDLTGGIAEEISLKSWENQLDIFKKLLQAYEKNCLMSACIYRVNKRRYGLIGGHAYSVNKVVQFRNQGKMVRLLRVRNPWGNSTEWNGDWSDTSLKWKLVSDDIKDQINFHRKADGEFFICLEDFVKMFSEVTICHLSIGSIDDSARGWKMAEIKGSWTPKKSLYPSLNFQYSHYLIKLEDTDNDGLCSLLISVMQQGARKHKGECGENSNGDIGFELYQVDPKRDLPLTLDFFESALCEKAYIQTYKRRAATQRLQLRPGFYVVVPKKESTCPSEDFLIRVCYEGNGFFKSLN